ncbi:holin [Escherichia phage McMelon]
MSGWRLRRRTHSWRGYEGVAKLRFVCCSWLPVCHIWRTGYCRVGWFVGGAHCRRFGLRNRNLLDANRRPDQGDYCVVPTSGGCKMIISVLLFVIIGASSLFNVYAPSVRDGIFGRVLYLLTAMVCIIGLLQTGDVSDATWTALIWLFALRTLRNAVLNGVKHAIQ